QGQFIFLNRNNRRHLPSIPLRNPYKGLQSFDMADTDLFFGRDRVIENLREKAEKCKLLVVAGASGTGKSSLVKAGLLPVLRDVGWRILPVIRPGADPVEALEEAFDSINENDPTLSPDSVSLPFETRSGDHVRSNKTESKTLPTPAPPRGIEDGLSPDLLEKCNEQKSVLLIDQYEELITQSDNEKRQQFVGILQQLLEASEDSKLKIIITVRADFEPQLRRGSLETLWEKGRCTVPPFTVDEFRQAIIGPIQQEAFIFESAENENGEKKKEIVDEIIEEVVQAAGALPLLSYTLSEIYNAYVADENKRHREFKRKYYDDLDGVMGALHNKADYVYKNLKRGKEQQTMKKIMLRMVSLEGDMAGRRASDSELAYDGEGENKAVNKIIDLLAKERLIVRGADYIEPAHDALVRVWVTLHDWIDSVGKERLLLFDKVRAAAIDAQQTGKLWDNDPRLESLKTELDNKDSLLNRREVDFVKKSLERKQKRARNRRIITAGVMAALSVLTVWALLNAQRANREANRLRAENLAVQARDAMATDKTKALRLAEAAYKIVQDNPLPTVQSRLSDAFHTLHGKTQFYTANFVHAREITAAEFSPDGKFIFTASRDETATLWDAQHQAVRNFKHGNLPITLAAFSPDSKTILAAGLGGFVKLWDITGTLRDSVAHSRDGWPSILDTYSAVYSADGKYILTAGQDNRARLWTNDAQQKAEMPHDGEVFSAVFSPDSSKILTASADSTAIIWDLQGNALDTLAGHQSQVNTAIFSPDGKFMLTAARDGVARLWDANGNLRDSLDHVMNRDIHFNAVFSEDSQHILTASADCTAIVWDTTGNALDTLNHRGMVYTAIFSLYGRNILTASADSTARLWDRQGNLLAIFQHNGDVTKATFSPDGAQVLTASNDGTAKLWRLQNTRTLDFNKPAYNASFAPAGEKILTISEDHVAKIWDLQSGDVERFALGERTDVASFSPDSIHLFTETEYSTVRLWDWRQAKMVDSLANDDFDMHTAIFSPDGKKVLAICFDSLVRIWNVAEKFTDPSPLELQAEDSEITAAAFSPDGNRIITASPDGYARIWSTNDTPSDSLDHFGEEVFRAAFSPVTDNYLTVASDNFARLWNAHGQVFDSLGVEKIKSADYSHYGKHVLITAWQGPARVWHLQTQKQDSLPHPENIAVTAGAFSPNDSLIITAAEDGVARLWSLQGEALAEYGNSGNNELLSAKFSPDGKMILTLSFDNRARLWWTPQAIFDWLKQANVWQLSDVEKMRYGLK
ncbi:MAG: WD40 repeat domain-containing protein, partial [bacterium]